MHFQIYEKGDWLYISTQGKIVASRRRYRLRTDVEREMARSPPQSRRCLHIWKRQSEIAAKAMKMSLIGIDVDCASHGSALEPKGLTDRNWPAVVIKSTFSFSGRGRSIDITKFTKFTHETGFSSECVILVCAIWTLESGEIM